MAKSELQEKYDLFQDEIAKMITDLKSKLEKHKTEQKKFDRDWGYVGDLQLIKNELNDINILLA